VPYSECDPLISAAVTTLEQVEARGAVSGRRPKFFYFQLLDAFRLGMMTRDLADVGARSEVFTPEAIEVLVRRLVEQAILTCYMETHTGPEVIDRFLKTSAGRFVKSWGEEHETDDKDLAVKEPPDYREMAKAADQTLYASYQRLSYLAHPRAGLYRAHWSSTRTRPPETSRLGSPTAAGVKLRSPSWLNA
jgi:hypothetical protein